MTGRMRQRRAYWLGGTATALVGVGLARLLSPELAGTAATVTQAAGYLLVAVGIAILAAATRRRDAEAFKSATNHEHRE
ncbi:MAG: hypothetical protein QF491_17545 [Alphaproteobacteria bacterium]|jgi:uncharacterized membrane protein HdeD (DUF308 family)|nr:hypothetical protein [Alphaproteobacteria bacterium]